MPFLLRYSSVINMVLLALIALMGLWLRAEFLDFASTKLQPIADRLAQESFQRQMDVQRLQSLSEQQVRAMNELRDAMVQMRTDVRRIYEEAVPRAK